MKKVYDISKNDLLEFHEEVASLSSRMKPGVYKVTILPEGRGPHKICQLVKVSKAGKEFRARGEFSLGVLALLLREGQVSAVGG